MIIWEAVIEEAERKIEALSKAGQAVQKQLDQTQADLATAENLLREAYHQLVHYPNRDGIQQDLLERIATFWNSSRQVTP